MTATFRIVRRHEIAGGGYAFEGTLDEKSLEQLPKSFETSYLYDQANAASDVLSQLAIIYRIIEDKDDARG